MVKKDLSVTFLGVKFPNPFCLSSSPVGNDYDMCKKAYDVGWGGIVFKTIGPKSYVINEVSPRFDKLDKEAEPFIGFKNMEQIAEIVCNSPGIVTVSSSKLDEKSFLVASVFSFKAVSSATHATLASSASSVTIAKSVATRSDWCDVSVV